MPAADARAAAEDDFYSCREDGLRRWCRGVGHPPKTHTRSRNQLRRPRREVQAGSQIQFRRPSSDFPVTAFRPMKRSSDAQICESDTLNRERVKISLRIERFVMKLLVSVKKLLTCAFFPPVLTSIRIQSDLALFRFPPCRPIFITFGNAQLVYPNSFFLKHHGGFQSRNLRSNESIILLSQQK